MDAMAAADACSCAIVDDVLPCETAASLVRRRRIEIRRFKLLASSGADGFVEPLKRARIPLKGLSCDEDGSDRNKKPKDGQLDKECKGDEQISRNQDFQENTFVSRDQNDTCATENCDNKDDLSSRITNSREGQDGEGKAALSEVAGLTNALQPCCAAVDQCPPYGTVSVCGRRREMEDAVMAVPDLLSLPCALGGCTVCPEGPASSSAFHFFGVYDGHGGSQAAAFCQSRLHHALVEEMNVLRDRAACSPFSPSNQVTCWENAMMSCFLKVDEEVRRTSCGGQDCEKCSGNGCEGPSVPDTVGSTAVVAVVGCNQIIIANCGDSRAVLSRGGRAIPLSNDHKPGRPDEMARIEAAGGRVINWDVHRILGILAMSRSIGDKYMSPYVIADPEVTCTERTGEDECLILASDGLWDKVTNEAACEIARRCLAARRDRNGMDASGSALEGNEESPSSAAASLLLKIALGNGSKDNISVVVVDLKR